MNIAREKHILLAQLGSEVETALEDSRAILAGGAITSLFTGNQVRDYDLYFRNSKDAVKALELFEEHGTVEFATDRAKTFKWGKKWKKKGKERKPFQIIYTEKLCGEPTQIFDKYDFTICMGAYDFKTQDFSFHPDFMKHLAERRLVFHTGTMYPICSLIRVIKYLRRGYKITGVEMMKMALAVQRLKIETMADLRDQLMGIDTLFLRNLTDKFKEGETAKREYEFEAFMHMVDEYIAKACTHLATGDEDGGE